jgi:hypothetical protein
MQKIFEIIRLFFRSGAKHPSTVDSCAAPSLQAFFRELAAAYGKGLKHTSAFDSMTTTNELLFLQHYAKDVYSGRGKIVDLGCWLGATSAALAEGLSGRRFSGALGEIEAYDLFEWREWMNPIKEAIGAKVDFHNGECFHSHVRKDLARYGDLVALHKVDLVSYSPPEDWLIEFLFIDAMKSWDLAGSIASNFFPKMITGQSLVVQQDFAYHHPTVSTNHLLMWHLRDFFKPLHHVPDSCSMVFSTEKTPSVSDIPKYSLNYFSEEDVLSAYRYCIPMVHESMRPSLMVAKLCHGLICHQRRTVTTAIEELGDRQLETGIKQTILESLKNSRSSGSAEWNEFAVRTAEKLEIKPDL